MDPSHRNRVRSRLKRAGQILPALACIFALKLFVAGLPAEAATEPAASFGARLDAPEADVLQAVHEVASDQIIHGTFSYEKEKILYGAHAADSSTAFRDSPAGSNVFYKVAERVLAGQGIGAWPVCGAGG